MRTEKKKKKTTVCIQWLWLGNNMQLSHITWINLKIGWTQLQKSMCCMIHLDELEELGNNPIIEIRAAVPLLGGTLTKTWWEGNFWGDWNILYLDGDIGYTFVKLILGGQCCIIHRFFQKRLSYIFRDAKVKNKEKNLPQKEGSGCARRDTWVGLGILEHSIDQPWTFGFMISC